MSYPTTEQIKQAMANSYEVTINNKRGATLQKGHRHIWEAYCFWQTADLIDGKYCNHLPFDTLEEAIDRPY